MITLIREFYTPWSDFWDRYQNPKTKGWPLLGDPVPILIFLAIYNYFILSLGPRLMKNRPPFDLRKTMMVYNMAQIIMNGYVVIMGVIHVWIPMVCGWRCLLPDATDSRFGILVFMVLRKKQDQVTFLHQYHHVGMCLAGWGTTTLFPGGCHVLLFGFVNCTVHVVMYSYYLLTIYNPAWKSSTWKRRITEMQLAQFVITTLHGISGILDPSCVFPKWALCMYVPQDMFMFALFWDFYVKTYLKPRKKATQPKENIEDQKDGKKSE